ncbi:MAG: murein biosynthesis integral membrane protein MurJ [Planctomycetota bacterium]|jgi:putative peptidoglycan lipid II flippase
MTDRFESNARTVSVLTLVSRVTGLVREACLSRIFGAGGLMDAFFLAFLVPNLFRRLFGEGALAAAFLPEYARLERSDPDVARRLATVTLSLLVVALGGLVIAGEVLLLALSALGGHDHLALWLTMVMLPYAPLVCMVALVGAMLQVHGRFGPTAAAPIVLNGCMVATAVGAGLILDPGDGRARAWHVGAVAGSVVLAGVLQLLWSVRALPGAHRPRGWALRGAGDPLRRVLGQAGPMIVGLGVLQLNVFIDGLIASYPTTFGPTILGVDYPLREGAMAAVTFAQRLYQFPLGVFGIAVATAIFPLLARQRDDGDAFAATVRRGLRLVVFIGLPASAGLVLVRVPLASVVLEGGAFSAADTRRVGAVLLGYAPAIWAYSMIHVLTRAFYARGESARPVRVAVGMVGLNLLLNCTLIWTPLREAGLAWSTAICAVAQSALLLAMLRRDGRPVVTRPVLASWGRTAAATAAMTLVVATCGAWLPPAETWLASLAALLIQVAAGAGTIVAAALALRMPELAWALGRRAG